MNAEGPHRRRPDHAERTELDGPDERDDRLYGFRRNIIVAASAGTGKTFRLVTLYTLLVLGLTERGPEAHGGTAPMSPVRIAATTFSRAAALEIRERVERLVSAVASGRFEPDLEAYRSILEQRALRLCGRGVDAAPFRRAAEQALSVLPSACIDTLHGLAGELLRDAALELGLSPDFEILDEDAAAESARRAIDAALRASSRDETLGMKEVLEVGGGLASARQGIGQLLDRLAEEGIDVEALEVADALSDRRELVRDLLETCRALAEESSRTYAEPARALLAASGRFEPFSLAFEELEPLLASLFCKRKPSKPSVAEEGLLSLRDSLRGTNPEKARGLARFLTAAEGLPERARAVRAVLAEALRTMASERLAASTLTFADVLRLARDALGRNPDVGRRARGRFDVLLVDEFQDTSRVQRDLVYLLREREDRAAGRPPGRMPSAADLLPWGLMLVGDRKQSIYGFRGADVSVWNEVCRELAGPSATALLGIATPRGAPSYADLLTLSENRRSTRAILSFVNAFATRDFSDGRGRAFEAAYARAEWLSPGPNAGAGPEVAIVCDDGEEGRGEPKRAATSAMREALLAARVVAHTARAEESAERARGEEPGRGLYRGCAILVRRRAMMPLVELALERLGVPFVLADRSLFDTSEVRDAGALLRLCIDPSDRHALAAVLRGPVVALEDASLALLAQPGRGLSPPAEWFASRGPAGRLEPSERERLRAFRDKLERAGSAVVGLSAARAVRFVITAFELDRVSALMPRAPQRLSHLDRVVALAHAHGGNLPGFVRWLSRRIQDDADDSEPPHVSESADAVTLLTIHASKGLEFRTVVLVDLGAGVRPRPVPFALLPGAQGRPARLVLRHRDPTGDRLDSPENARFDEEARARDAAERRRVLYVALTRAREQLFLIASRASPSDSAMATLKQLMADDGALAAAGASVRRASEFLREAPPPPLARTSGSPEEMRCPPALAPPEPPLPRTLSLGVSALVTFSQCERRYRLVHELGLDEPSPSADLRVAPAALGTRARALGTAAHRVLEQWPLASWGERTELEAIAQALTSQGVASDAQGARELAVGVARFLSSPFARRARDEADAVRREEPFALRIESKGREMILRGSMDLLLTFPDGRGEIIDYKWAVPRGPEPYEFQLRTYAVAALRHAALGRVRAGIAHLGAAFEEPAYLPDTDDRAMADFERRLGEWLDRFAAVRASNGFARVVSGRCRALRCGFADLCDPERSTRPLPKTDPEA